MAIAWRELVPHFMAMFVIYGVIVIALMTQGIESFWISLAVALTIAFFYPRFTRAFDVAPEPWQRD